MSTRWGLASGTILWALLVTSAAVGCGQQVGLGTPVDLSAGAVAERVQAEVQLNGIEVRLNGTLEQRSSAAKLVYTRFQAPIVRCMSAAGLRYTPPRFVDPYAGWADERVLAEDEVLAPVDLPTVSRDALLVSAHAHDAAVELERQGRNGNAGFTSLGPQEQLLYARQSQVCLPAPESYADLGVMPGSSNLNAALDEVLSKAKRSPGVRQAVSRYPSCMRAQGFPVPTRVELVKQLEGRFRPGTAAPVASGGDIWNALVKQEHDAAAADVKCRLPAHDLAYSGLAEELVRFAVMHDEALQQVDSAWSGTARAADANAQGFDELQRLSNA